MGMVSGQVLQRDMPDAQYAVFDDMRGGITMFPSFKEWFGAQSVVTVKALYRDPVQIQWGKPCIWLANADPREQLKADITERTAGGALTLFTMTLIGWKQTVFLLSCGSLSFVPVQGS